MKGFLIQYLTPLFVLFCLGFEFLEIMHRSTVLFYLTLSVWGLIAFVTFAIGMLNHWRSTFSNRSQLAMFSNISALPFMIFVLSLFALIFYTSNNDYFSLHGVPTKEGSRFFIKQSGELIREISENAYHDYQRKIGIQLLLSSFFFYSFGQMLILNKGNKDH